MQKYFKRVADEVLPELLESTGALLVAGPKWCGKTTTAMLHAESVVKLQDPDNGPTLRRLAEEMPSRILKGSVPRLIDEWQVCPWLWDAVRNEVDLRNEFSQFILTGSAVPPDRAKILHSGVGRISKFVMRPFSLFESLESNGGVSIGELFSGKCDVDAESAMRLPDYAQAICRGGWPKSIGIAPKPALRLASNFYRGLVDSDMQRYDGKKRSPQRMQRLMRAFARVVATQARSSAFIKCMAANDDEVLNRNTVHSYLEVLRGLYIVEDLPSWSPDFRERTQLLSTDKRHFVDPSIGCAALGLSPSDLLDDPNGLGLLFESLAVRDLRVYAEALGGKVYHYHDAKGLEADAVIHLNNGKHALFEVKLTSLRNIDDGAENLKAIRGKLDSVTMRHEPSFLAVITATEHAYRRKDGVYVLPLGCLKP